MPVPAGWKPVLLLAGMISSPIPVIDPDTGFPQAGRVSLKATILARNPEPAPPPTNPALDKVVKVYYADTLGRSYTAANATFVETASVAPGVPILAELHIQVPMLVSAYTDQAYLDVTIVKDDQGQPVMDANGSFSYLAAFTVWDIMHSTKRIDVSGVLELETVFTPDSENFSEGTRTAGINLATHQPIPVPITG